LGRFKCRIIGINECLGSELCSDDRVRFDKSGLPSIALPRPDRDPATTG